MLADRWVDVFLAHYVGDAPGDRASLARVLAEAFAELPTTASDVLAAELGRRGITAPHEVALADLYVAVSCSAGDEAALRRFDTEYLEPTVAEVARRVRFSPEDTDELAQQSRILLLAATDQRSAKLGEYSARCALRGWLAVVVHRVALRMIRKRPNHVPVSIDEGLPADLASPAPGAERVFAKESYREVFRKALFDGFRALPPKERLILRQYYLDRLSIDDLARIYGVHRSSTHRRLAAAQARLSARCRDLVRSRLPMSDTEFASIYRNVESAISITLGEVLDSSE